MYRRRAIIELDLVIILLNSVFGFAISMQDMFTSAEYTGDQADSMVGNGKSQKGSS